MDESMTRPTDGRPGVAVVTVGNVRFGMQLCARPFAAARSGSSSSLQIICFIIFAGKHAASPRTGVRGP